MTDNIINTVINDTLNKLKKRSAKLESLIYGNPLSELITVRSEGYKVITEHKGDHKKINELLGPLAKKEKLLLAASKAQSKNCNKWMDEKVKIDFEMNQLINDQYYLNK